MPSSTSTYLLNLDNEKEIVSYLRQQAWIKPDETVSAIQKAGDGNMNLVLRITLKDRSFIVKQSRPWVEKYPQIPAPEDRLLVETAFYDAVKHVTQVAARMPTLMAVDERHRVAQIEDLGEAADFTSMYEDPSRTHQHLPALCTWLSALHNSSFSELHRSKLLNKDMRALNFEHIFDLPLAQENHLDLNGITEGFQLYADHLKQNPQFTDTVAALGRRYLLSGSRNRDVLLHGDYYPGSWLATPEGPFIIDPEFCFFGDAEFDVGVFIAHMLIAGCSEEVVNTIFDLYEPPRSFVQTMALQYAGTEIMRRLIGVAQLPLSLGLKEKVALLKQAERLVLKP